MYQKLNAMRTQWNLWNDGTMETTIKMYQKHNGMMGQNKGDNGKPHQDNNGDNGKRDDRSCTKKGNGMMGLWTYGTT